MIGYTMKSTDDWLKEKQEVLGGSEVAAVLGVDPWKGPLDVYESKINGYSHEDKDVFFIGHVFEDPIGRIYERKTGRDVGNVGATEIQRHPDIPWLGVTLDRITWGSASTPAPDDIPRSGPLEIKTVGSMKSNGWDDGAPVWVEIQNQNQIHCVGAYWGSMTALIGGVHLKWYDQSRNDAFLEAAYPIMDEFWQRVQRRDPPLPSGPKSLEPIKRLYAYEDGQTILFDDPAVAVAVTTWEKAKVNRDESKMRADEIEAELRAMMGEASFGALPDGSYLTLRKTTRKDGTTYRTLRRQWFR